MSKENPTELDRVHPYKANWGGKLIANLAMLGIADLASNVFTDNPIAKGVEILSLGILAADQAGVKTIGKQESKLQWAADSFALFTLRAIITVIAIEAVFDHGSALSTVDGVMLTLATLSTVRSIANYKDHNRQAQLANKLNNPPKPKKERRSNQNTNHSGKSASVPAQPQSEGYVIWSSDPSRYPEEAPTEQTLEEKMKNYNRDLQQRFSDPAYEKERAQSQYLNQLAIDTHDLQAEYRYFMAEQEMKDDTNKE